MTHEELLAKIDNYTCCSGAHELALLAVVELHKPEYWQNPSVPEWNGANCTHCLAERGDYMSPVPEEYPCPTIQAIEKELG